MHTPWAGSNRYKISELMSFIAERPLPGDSPSLPFWARFNEKLRTRRQHYGFTHTYKFAAILNTGPLAKSYPRGILPRLSSKHFQSARSPHCSSRFCQSAVFHSINVRYDVSSIERIATLPCVIIIHDQRMHFLLTIGTNY